MLPDTLAWSEQAKAAHDGDAETLAVVSSLARWSTGLAAHSYASHRDVTRETGIPAPRTLAVLRTLRHTGWTGQPVTTGTLHYGRRLTIPAPPDAGNGHASSGVGSTEIAGMGDRLESGADAGETCAPLAA
ncbi:hypothetical protein BKD30_04115 [Tersicoccus phoenicis]|uniref:Uncharacterized protein n=1 Tax=Tersicoccus phoenicis TaxID=554083 RepID=A0A1R1LHU6_9MICC|nr:hypothetical protein [Tersicoccus phoenicis]OMH27079.1 hypothetical protein BKD30_04115 [Tersicoccus phoenicis]